MKKNPLGIRLEIHHQSGFSLIEMTLVLAILAIGATTAMSVANNRMEERITSRTVSELSIAAEAAYECYVAGDCKDSAGEWVSTESLNLEIRELLPASLRGQYVFSPAPGDPSKAKISVDMDNAGRAGRVARAFGSSAEPSDKFVVVTLGIPGAERMIASVAKRIVEDGTLDKVTVGTTTMTEQDWIALTNLRSLRNLECPAGLAVQNGIFMCSPRPLIRSVSSSSSAAPVWTKRHQIGGRLVLKNGVLKFKSVYR